MKAHYDPRPQLAQVEVTRLDGIICWPLADVCRALRIPDQAAASRLIPAKCKLYCIKALFRYDKRRLCYITAEGVEALALRYGRIPLHQIMEALPYPQQ